MKTRVPAGLIAGFVLVVVTACGGGGTSNATQPPGGGGQSPNVIASLPPGSGAVAATECTTGDTGSEHIQFGGGKFTPADLTVAAGTTVTWVNDEKIPHQLVFKGGTGLTCGITDPHSATSVTFATPGTYDYYCQFHFMTEKGKITVQ